MKIVKVSCEQFKWPRERPITNGKHTYTHEQLGLVKIETDEGITGIGVGAEGRIVKQAIDHLSELLIGEDPIDVERIWYRLWEPKLVGRRGLTTRAISAIDMLKSLFGSTPRKRGGSRSPPRQFSAQIGGCYMWLRKGNNTQDVEQALSHFSRTTVTTISCGATAFFGASFYL